jgi:hypothetical protein
MKQDTILDSLGNTIELTYDSDTDIVKVKNNGVDTDFREVKRMAMWNPNLVLELETLYGGDDGWDTYSDEITRYHIRLFWENNKVNQD